MAKYNNLFDGSLDVYTHQKFNIDLLLVLELVQHCMYPVPCAYEQTFKKKFQHIVDIGILDECGASEWASSCFIVAKKMAGSDKS